MTELLAKAPHGEKRLTLLKHTIDVMDASEWLFGSVLRPTRLGREWLRFFKIPVERFPGFSITLLASAAFHDWGKANDGFQKEVGEQKHGSQVIRHEHLSALMLGLDGMSHWLQSEQEIDLDIMLAAVMSHHLKVKMETFATRLNDGLGFQLLNGHPDFLRLVEDLSERLNLSKALFPFPAPFWGFRNQGGTVQHGLFDLQQVREQIKNRLRGFKMGLRNDPERNRMLWAVRAALIASDAVGSGLPRVGEGLEPWIQGAFDEAHLCTESFVKMNVIDKRVKELERRGKWRQWDAFQLQCEHLPTRALLLAPCGSGKTLAAWRWIMARLAERPAARVIFLYPTRSTAKEGFRDYVSWAPESDAALMHATSAYDLQDMFGNPDDPRHESKYEVDRRVFSLGYWHRRIFSATVDQFLAFLQYGYGSVCMLPVIADSILVIDEVHSFDRTMFSALKDFLKTFDLPVLCMTATLLDNRKDDLVNQCGLTLYSDRPGQLLEVATAPRYRLRRTTQIEAPVIVENALADGKRVLWVVNQVKRAQQTALSLAATFPDEKLRVSQQALLHCYHSRFKLDDRRKRHDEVVFALQPDRPPAAAITTQVCEMSLDIDADLLVSECCPTTALIQRMGRCNRSRTPRPLSCAGEVWVYQPLDQHGRSDNNPYDPDDFRGLDELLAGLETCESINQLDLEQLLSEVPSPPVRGDTSTQFLNSGPYAMAGEDDFRDIEEFTIPAVLTGDVAMFLELQHAKHPTDGLMVPVPRHLGKGRDVRLPSYLAVARDDHYHPLIGFCDEPISRIGD